MTNSNPCQLYNIPTDVTLDILNYLNPNRLHMLASYSYMARWVVNGMDRGKYIVNWLSSCGWYVYKYNVGLYNIKQMIDDVLKNYWYFKLDFDNDTYPILIKSIGAIDKKYLYLDLSDTNITDIEIKELYNVHILDLRRCYNITDIGICNGALSKVHTLCVSYCNNITDIGINSGMLSNVHSLDLSCNNNITDISALGNVHTLNLTWCNNVTTIGNIFNVYILILDICDKLKDLTILSNLHTLYGMDLRNLAIQKENMNILANIHTLEISCSIPRDFIMGGKGLVNVHTLNLRAFTNIKQIVGTGNIHTLKLPGGWDIKKLDQIATANLHVLDISECDITNINMLMLDHIPKIINGVI